MTLNKLAFGSLFFFTGFALGGLLYYQEPPTGSYPLELCEEFAEAWRESNITN